MDAHRERLQTQLNGLSHRVAGLRTRLSNLKDHLLVTATENQTFLQKAITNLLTGTKFRGFFAPVTATDDDPIEDCMNGYSKPPSERAPYTEEFVKETNLEWCMTLPIIQKFAKRLDGYKNELKSSLEDQGINWKLDYRQVPSSMTVSTTSGDPHITNKACQILKLLANTNVDPSLILQIIDGSMQHVNISYDDMCEKFVIVKEVHLKWEELARRSLKEMAKLTQCRLFFSARTCTLTAVGTSDGLEMLRTMVEGVFLYGVDLAQCVKIKCKESNETVDRSLAESSTWASFTEYYGEDRAKRVQDAWPMVKSFLQDNGISCELSVSNRSMKVSATTEIKDRDRIVRARCLLELLGRTNVPPSLAIEIMNSRRQHIFMKIGQQEGGLCSSFGIEKVEYENRLRRLSASIEEIIGLTGANLYHYVDTVTLVGGAVGQSEDLGMARMLVEGYIVHNVEHDCVRKLKLMKSGKRKDREGEDVLATIQEKKYKN